MRQWKHPGYLTAYAAYAGISRQAMAKQLQRLGIDYSQPFDWEEVDRRRFNQRHPSRDTYRKGRFGRL